jgi:Flp pilus assembly protein TadG
VSSPRSVHGQAAVELVTLLPLILVLLAGATQVVLAGHAWWAASAAAHAAARAHAIGSPELPAARRSLPSSLDDRVAVEDAGDGVAVHLRIPAVLPGLDLGTLTARASFAPQR